MLKCKDVSQILSRDVDVTFIRRLEIHFHLLICKHCRKFSKQIQILKISAKKFMSTKSIEINPTTITKIEDQMIDKIKKY